MITDALVQMERTVALLHHALVIEARLIGLRQEYEVETTTLKLIDSLLADILRRTSATIEQL